MSPKSFMNFLVLIAMLTTGRFASAQEFSAIQISRDTIGHAVRSKVYMSGNKVRYDPQETVSADKQTYTILDLAQYTSVVVNVGQKSYTQRPMSRLDRQVFALVPSPCPPAGATCKDDGSEMPNGRIAEKWEISQSMQGQTLLTRVWVDAKLYVWIKVESVAGATMVFSNEMQDIKEGPQPASLFVMPAGYRAAPF